MDKGLHGMLTFLFFRCCSLQMTLPGPVLAALFWAPYDFFFFFSFFYSVSHWMKNTGSHQSLEVYQNGSDAVTQHHPRLHGHTFT